MLCDVHNTPPGPWATNARIDERISRAVAGSSEAVGSSRSNSVGWLSIALASDTRVCSPDESTPHFTLRNRSRSNCAISRSIRSPSLLTPYSSPKKRRFSATVRFPGTGAYAAAKLVCASASHRLVTISCLPIRIVPAVGSRTPRIMLMLVVLPAPFGPSRPTISPALTSKETSSTATRSPYSFRMPATDNTATM